ncbi:10971_t:CDS:2 [Dentiscutata heterogama]|uniref:10971_t:CDS:1 n=1 Tax=Dentiscutata heterogama TaxID=1316150 RepID=A0ACA9JZT4_9GLOM|nr:10971_t:CDS:2 [Dentiscutata heterogama]
MAIPPPLILFLLKLKVRNFNSSATTSIMKNRYTQYCPIKL